MAESQVLCPFCSGALDIELYNGTYGCESGCDYVRFEVFCPTCKRNVYRKGEFGYIWPSDEDEAAAAEYRERYMAEFVAEVVKINAERAASA